MGKVQKRYPKEFRDQVIALHRTGRKASDLARQFELAPQTVANWINQVNIDEGRFEGLATVERDELKRLRRENKRLQLERDILSKAAAWFARETKVVPSEDSNS